MTRIQPIVPIQLAEKLDISINSKKTEPTKSETQPHPEISYQLKVGDIEVTVHNSTDPAILRFILKEARKHAY